VLSWLQAVVAPVQAEEDLSQTDEQALWVWAVQQECLGVFGLHSDR
jgi:hypothetical protein